MQLRYINLGKAGGALGWAAWEFGRITKPKEITMLSFVLDKEGICTAGLSPVKEYVYVDKIPEGMEVGRIFVKEDKKFSAGGIRYGKGAVLVSEGGLFLYVYFPCNLKDTPQKVRSSVAEILRNQGIKSFYVGNDSHYKTTKGSKKFGGSTLQRFGDWAVFSMFFSLAVNMDLMKKLFRFNTEKFTKKENFKDIEDIVGGLDEVGNITEDFLPQIAEGLAKRLNLKIRFDTLSEVEREKLEALTEKLKDDKWGYEAIHPEIK